ncbi:conserved hypothetical protein [Neospora caninum Liverpool]|uniref:Uncharacterized protein n=1 Tax=Neospora caninum (strain Liverpool) TaxID=572307 RepID=F0V801_NEOCL|nr:conserved hypothetical protein [Neospora caninum Liverpool]CBZ49842.1 conserved hypothetical protein [Neospora caninum Liverpool]|eukprot:XP_003879877.1 conserved hypothetical protein [Neospora caninum Liverpool]
MKVRTKVMHFFLQVAAGDHCPPGYSVSKFGTCEARKQVGPSLSCPEGFVLGGEQTNPYAILSQEFAKCGAVEYYRGKVWCPEGFLPAGIDIPNLPFGSSLDAFGTVDKIAEAAEAGQLPSSPRSLKARQDMNSRKVKKAKVHKVADELRSVFPDSFVDVLLRNTLQEMQDEAEVGERDEGETRQRESGKVDGRNEVNHTEQPMDNEEKGKTQADEAEEDLDEDIWIVDDTETDTEVDSEPDDNSGFHKNESPQSRADRAWLHSQGTQSATDQPVTSKITSEGSSGSLDFLGTETMFKQTQLPGSISVANTPTNVSAERQHGTSESLSRDGEAIGLPGRDSNWELRRKRRMQEPRKVSEGAQATPDLIMQLEAKIPPGGACVHLVGVFEAHCDKIECHGAIMKKIHKIVYDWVDYRLRVDIRQVDMFIPNGKDFRRTTPG